MRCTFSLCQSGNTKRIERTIKLYYNGGNNIINASMEEIWLCHNCGNPFRPAVSRIMKWHLPFGKRKKISKSAIVEELFR